MIVSGKIACVKGKASVVSELWGSFLPPFLLTTTGCCAGVVD